MFSLISKTLTTSQFNIQSHRLFLNSLLFSINKSSYITKKSDANFIINKKKTQQKRYISQEQNIFLKSQQNVFLSPNYLYSLYTARYLGEKGKKQFDLMDRRDTSGLKAIFEPKSVAIVGATDRFPSVGRTIVNNLISGNEQGGKKYKIFAVNPTRKTVLSLPCYPSIEAIPEDVDMVVFVTPAKSCLAVMKQCAKKKVKAAVVISAGFKEAGPAGLQLEKSLVEIARESGIRVIGPNCVGVMNPNFGLNATFAATMGLPGSVAFISQSGAMCTAILDWSLREKIGFSAFISVGSMADVHWGDMLDYLGSDTNTKSILVYMETIGDAAMFMGAAREVGLKKPIAIIKAGKTEAAAAAAASHTGSLAGSYASFEAAMRTAGIINAKSIQELANITLLMSKQPRPAGPNLMIITNAGGPAVLATDATITSGAQIAKLSQTTIDKLNAFLPPAWSHSNPVDILGDASADLYAKTLEVVLEDEHSDAVLVCLSPQDVTDPTTTAKTLITATEKMRQKGGKSKPVLAAWMGGDSVQKGFQLLNEAGIPTFSYSDSAAATFGQIWQQIERTQKLYGDPDYRTIEFIPSITKKDEALKIFDRVYQDNRTLLTEAESKEVLELYGIKTAQTIVAKTIEEAEEAAKKINSPLYAVKLDSKTLTHKADVGGVQLKLKKEEVSKAFETIKKNVARMHGLEHFQGVTVQPMIQLEKGLELILGSTTDSQFGPMMLFGSGGTMVEVYKDTALAIPPLDGNGAEELLKQTKIYKALKGGHGKRFEGVDIPELKLILTKFSLMITELAGVIHESDLNPLLATADKQFIALDARIVLKKKVDDAPIITMRPYPAKYISSTTIPSIGKIEIRPTTPTDKDALHKFHKTLSSETVKKRYLKSLSVDERLSMQALVSICYSNFDRHITLVAIKKNSKEIIAQCDLERPPPNHLHREQGQLHLIVTDEYQKKGVGKLITEKMMQVAKEEGLQEVKSITLKENVPFTKLVARLGWKAKESRHDHDVVITSVKL